MNKSQPFWKTNWFRVTFGSLISVVFIVLALKDVPLNDVALSLARANYLWVLLAVAGAFAQSTLRTVRAIQLYYPWQKGLRLPQMLGITLISQMLNIVVPWRVGEIARIYLVGEIEKRSKTQTLATLAVEKFFDTLMLLVLLLIIPLFMALPDWLEGPREGIIVTTVVLFVIAFGLLLSEDWLFRLVAKLPIPWGKQLINDNLRIALGSLDVLKRWDLHLGLQLLSIVIWLLGVVINYLVLLALNLQLPLISAFLLLAVLQFGSLVPSSPGKLGVFQYLCILTLSLFSVDKSAGLTYGILLYLVAFGTPIVSGIFSVWWVGVNVQQITANETEAR